MGKRRMGAFWMLFEPLAHLLIFTLVIGAIRGRHVAGLEYPVFLLVGLAPFLLCRNIALRLMESVGANQALFAYKQIQPLDTFVGRALIEFILYSIVYIILVAGFAWWGFDMRIAYPMQWIVILFVGIMFAFGLGVNFAIIAHAAPGVKTFISLSFLPLYFLSGVMFPPSYLPPGWMPYLMWNPFLHFLELLRAAVFPYYMPVEGVSLMYVGGAALLLQFAGLGLYRARRLKLMAVR